MEQSQSPTKFGFGTLQRPRYSAGLLLEDEDLNSAVSYTRDLTRLLFKSLFGCGVICGLRIKPELTCNGRKVGITVTKGIALDCMGNPLEVPEPVTVEYDPDCDKLPPSIWVVVCYVEKCCRPRDTSCSSDDDSQPKPTRVRAGFEIRLHDKRPECACRCATDVVQQGDSARPANDCCDDGTVVEQRDTGADTKSPDPCKCYTGHYEGECACDCGCTCVVLGRVVTANIGNKDAVDTDMVRKIRPILNGREQCLERAKPKPSDPTVMPSAPQAPVTPETPAAN
jgi:hypothetical protein